MVLEAGLSKQAGASTAIKKTPEELEAEFVRHTAAILVDAPARTLKVMITASLSVTLCVAILVLLPLQ